MRLLDLIIAGNMLGPTGVSWDGVDEFGCIGTITVLGVTSIPKSMFCGVYADTWMLSDEITTLHEDSFLYCNAGWDDFPQSIVSVGEGALAGIGSSGTLVLPNIEWVDAYAFYDSYGLSELTLGGIGHAVTSIGVEAFLDTSLLDTLTIYVDDPLNPPAGSPWGFAGTTLTFEEADPE